MSNDDTVHQGHLLPVGFRLEEFEVLSVLGEGGFGAVYLAHDHHLNQLRAIKEFLPSQIAVRVPNHSIYPKSGVQSEETYRKGLESFVHEAQLLAAIDHPNIVRVYRCIAANNTAYIVMHYCEGETLDGWAQRQGGAAPNPYWVQQLLWQLLDGLQVVHAKGVLHRDIKPANIYLIDGYRPVLIDFGAARRVVGELSNSLTSVITAGYSPIEQYGEVADAAVRQGPWTDIYALGATLYRLVKGSKPPEPHLRIMNDHTVPAVQAGAKRYPQNFLQSIDKALAVKPADRFQSVSEWRDVLGVLPGSPDENKPASTRAPAHDSKVLVRWAGVALLLGAVAFGGYYWKWRQQSPPPPPDVSHLQAELEQLKAQLAQRPVEPAPAPQPAVAPVPPKPVPTTGLLEAGQSFLDCPLCPELVVMPTGEFTMGSPTGEVGRHADEGPQHRLAFATPFALGKYEVTNAEWQRFITATSHAMHGCDEWRSGGWQTNARLAWNKPGFEQSGRNPAVCIAWEEASSYVKWLSEQTGKHYRLPSEAEWEYAARAGSAGINYWGGENKLACEYANFAVDPAQARACADKHANTAPVGDFRPNAFGLYDMLGNVWEWVADCWHANYEGAPADGGAWTADGDCGLRGVRGGSWADEVRQLRFANRDKESTGTGGTIHGLRVARTLETGEAGPARQTGAIR